MLICKKALKYGILRAIMSQETTEFQRGKSALLKLFLCDRVPGGKKVLRTNATQYMVLRASSQIHIFVGVMPRRGFCPRNPENKC